MNHKKQEQRARRRHPDWTLCARIRELETALHLSLRAMGDTKPLTSNMTARQYAARAHACGYTAHVALVEKNDAG